MRALFECSSNIVSGQETSSNRVYTHHFMRNISSPLESVAPIILSGCSPRPKPLAFSVWPARTQEIMMTHIRHSHWFDVLKKVHCVTPWLRASKWRQNSEALLFSMRTTLYPSFHHYHLWHFFFIHGVLLPLINKFKHLGQKTPAGSMRTFRVQTRNLSLQSHSL